MAPAFAGVLIAVASAGLVFLVMGLVVSFGAALLATVPGPVPAGEGEVRNSARREIASAVGAIRRERSARVLVAIVGVDFIALGALEVLYPPIAIDVSWARIRPGPATLMRLSERAQPSPSWSRLRSSGGHD